MNDPDTNSEYHKLKVVTTFGDLGDKMVRNNTGYYLERIKTKCQPFSLYC